MLYEKIKSAKDTKEKIDILCNEGVVDKETCDMLRKIVSIPPNLRRAVLLREILKAFRKKG